jgi:hypothetical protein
MTPRRRRRRGSIRKDVGLLVGLGRTLVVLMKWEVVDAVKSSSGVVRLARL